MHSDQTLLSLFFPRWNSPSFLSLFFDDRCWSLLIMDCQSPSWLFTIMGLVYSRVHTEEPALQMHLTSVEKRGGVSSFYLMARLLFIQPRHFLAFFAAWALCWLVFNWLPVGPQGLLLPGCFPSGWLTACSGACGYSSRGAGLCLSLCWTPWGSYQSLSPDCWGPSGWQSNYLVYEPLLPVLYHLQTCWGFTLSHHLGH